jgi:hypothetical protein
MIVAAATAPEVGVPLGILIGSISGGVAILLIRTGWRAADVKGAIEVVAQLLAIPTFWFGGPWLTTTMLVSVEPAEIRSSYFISLTAVFVALAGIPLAMLAWSTGRAIGAQATAPPRSSDA